MTQGSEQLKLLVGGEFPFPVAVAFKNAMESRDSRESLCHLLNQAIEFIAQVLLLDYLAQEDRDDKVDGELRRVLERPVTIGMWADWIGQVVRFFESRSRPPFLREAIVLLDRKVARDLTKLLRWRNDWAHEMRQFDLFAFREKLFGIIESAVFLRKYALLFPRKVELPGEDGLHSIEAAHLCGESSAFGTIECRSELPLETNRGYLYSRDSRELLCLHPLMICSACSECGAEHVFKFARATNGKLAYASVPAAHTLSNGDGYAFLEGLFERRESRTIRPRHFTIPGSFTAMPRTLGPGDRMGAYEVEELIKVGGMAQVYRVTDTRSGGAYALKLLPLELAKDPVLLERFEGEAASLKRLDHRNIIRFHDLGEDAGDRFIVLELASGRQVGNTLCRDVGELPKPLPEGEILEIALQACDGLACVHSSGIVHRDLKPSNLLLAGERVIVTDFGISQDGVPVGLTLTGMPIGTPEYMAPEQILGERVDGRSDVYALGCILYELATGRPPYRAASPFTVAMYHLQTRPPRIEELNPRISEGLVHVIYKALQKRPERRYQNVRGLAEDLSRLDEDPAGPQLLEGDRTPQSILEEVRSRERRRYRRVIYSLPAIILVVLALGFAGRAVYNRVEVGGLVDEARKAWAAGPERWEEACAALADALAIRPTDGRIAEARRRIHREGRLRVRTEPPGAEVEIRPDPEETRNLGLPMDPRVLDAGPTLASEAWIPLEAGHYRVTVTRGGIARRFPVFVGHVDYRRAPSAAWEGRPLLPTEEPASPSEVAEAFLFARWVDVGPVRLDEDAPADASYVPPGGFWAGGLDRLGPGLVADSYLRPGKRPEEPDAFGKVSSFWAEGSAWRTAGEGFFIGRHEVTVGEFEAWWKAFGMSCCRWMDDKSIVRELWLLSDEIPLDALVTHYADPSKSPPPFASRRELFDWMHRGWRTGWASVHDAFDRQLLPSLKPDDLPMRAVRPFVALAYARTHAPLIAGPFAAWVAEEIRLAGAILDALEADVSLVEAKGERLFEADAPRLPRLPVRGDLLMDISGEAKDPFPAYVAWFAGGPRDDRFQLRHACDVPFDLVFESAMARPGAPGPAAIESLRREVEEDPLARVGSEPLSAELASLTLDWHDDVEEGKAPIDRDLFVRWLRKTAREHRERKARLEALLDAVAAFGPEEELPRDETVPWDIRLEYGWAEGWGLPSVLEWERASRGGDGRLYPWGNELPASGHAWFGPRDDPLASRIVGLRGDRDISPFDVRGMAGNVSEWVADVMNIFWYAKGGNHVHDGNYTSALHVYGVPDSHSLPWVGFRVVKGPRRGWGPPAD